MYQNPGATVNQHDVKTITLSRTRHFQQPRPVIGIKMDVEGHVHPSQRAEACEEEDNAIHGNEVELVGATALECLLLLVRRPIHSAYKHKTAVKPQTDAFANRPQCFRDLCAAAKTGILGIKRTLCHVDHLFDRYAVTFRCILCTAVNLSLNPCAQWLCL